LSKHIGVNMQATATPTIEQKSKFKAPVRVPVYPEILTGEREARRIVAVCRHYSALPLEKLTALQLGASTGIMTEVFARHFKKVIAVDKDISSLQLSKKISRHLNIEYICAEGTNLTVDDNAADVLICDRYLEQTRDHRVMMNEIYRVLKYEGFCYFGATSKYTVIERNYFLPFLSWLPKAAAELYLKLAGHKGAYDPEIPSLGKLNKLTSDFWRHDYTRIIRRNPAEFFSEDIAKPGGFFAGLTLRFFKHFYPFLPTWVWVLTKRK